MLSIIIAFLTGLAFAGAIGRGWIRMLSKSKVPEKCHEQCKRINDLNCENVNLEKRYKIVMDDNRSILNNQTKYLTDISKELKK